MLLFVDAVQSKVDIGKTLLKIANRLDPGLSLMRGKSEKFYKDNFSNVILPCREYFDATRDLSSDIYKWTVDEHFVQQQFDSGGLQHFQGLY